MPRCRHVLLPERQRLARSDANLFRHQVDAGHHFRHRVLDLNSRIHFEKVCFMRLFVVDELDGSGPAIVDLPRQPDRRLSQPLSRGR